MAVLSPHTAAAQQVSPPAQPNSVQPNPIQPQSTPAPQDSPQRDLEILRRLEEEYLRAEIEDDTAIAGTILAEDYVGLKPDGTTLTKADVLNILGRHERRREPYLITATNMREHLFGDTACLTYTKVYTKPGSQTAYSENVLHLLTRRGGIWRLQLSSPLPSPKTK
jgi:hypothetical protein